MTNSACKIHNLVHYFCSEGVNINHYNALLLFSLFVVGGGVQGEIVPDSLSSLFIFLNPF